MGKDEILLKLNLEVKTLISLSETQFEERFLTSKHEDKWQDELFKKHQESKIRTEFALELLNNHNDNNDVLVIGFAEWYYQKKIMHQFKFFLSVEEYLEVYKRDVLKNKS